ncbi:MAG: glycosyltransferase family 2 protein [Pseudomonadales bacterium]|jgi:glycosyltransferase involved in cell wall biosynthesis|nr:glycosyltransferase family 2 protein [Pseudomonadales bacterium]MDP6472718.1 glycosyltransferase family 2 protein [Pseudomonadales bacterium]MDP6827929.1 glycosyltransferase family 2 protein [Pseudomonadales bacterium]MDP6973487.1 glycosyltransferase family 2 protein [Pseudomonadales bacterium]|tara:strand:- start:448 stop:1308 length:861 start_codon:yes stop_codon:yes gene_type:complete
MISVIIPAYNEKHAIGSTIDTLTEVLNEHQVGDYEILVVDDGSDDRTGKVARDRQASVVRNPHNVGYGRALKKGISHARYDSIVIIDADLTYPAEALPELLATYEEGFDMVVGARQRHHYQGSAIRGPLRRVLQYLVEFAASRPVPDANSGLRVFSRETITPHLDHLSDVFSFTTTLTLAYMMTGRFVKFISIEYHARIGDTKVRLFKDAVRTLLFICRAIMYYNPLKIFVLFSGTCAAGALLGFLLALITGLETPYYLSIGSILLGVLMFGIGLIAELLRQILIK